MYDSKDVRIITMPEAAKNYNIVYQGNTHVNERNLSLNTYNNSRFTIY